MTTEKQYPKGHNWEGLTPSQINEAYAQSDKDQDQEIIEKPNSVHEKYVQKPLSEKKIYIENVITEHRIYGYKEKDIAQAVNNVIKWASSGTRIIDGESVVNKMKEEFGDLK